MKLRKAKDSDEAFEMQKDDLAGTPHGWIQFKGTELCMDVHCHCGQLTHIDGMFIYHVKCVSCGRMYQINAHVELIEIEKEPESIYTTSN